MSLQLNTVTSRIRSCGCTNYFAKVKSNFQVLLVPRYSTTLHSGHVILHSGHCKSDLADKLPFNKWCQNISFQILGGPSRFEKSWCGEEKANGHSDFSLISSRQGGTHKLRSRAIARIEIMRGGKSSSALISKNTCHLFPWTFLQVIVQCNPGALVEESAALSNMDAIDVNWAVHRVRPPSDALNYMKRKSSRGHRQRYQ